MIDHHLDSAAGVLTLHPQGPLSRADFAELAAVVDPQIEQHGDLTGLVIDAAHFPGWDGFGALITHLRFVRDHHRHVRRIAVVTDSHLGDLAERLASHFVAAEFRHFPAGRTAEAKAWITGPQ